MPREVRDFTYEQLRRIFRLSFCPDFVGVTCKECKMTANVPQSFSGWTCECGFSGKLGFFDLYSTPHENPDRGPSLARIKAAIKANRSEKVAI